MGFTRHLLPSRLLKEKTYPGMPPSWNFRDERLECAGGGVQSLPSAWELARFVAAAPSGYGSANAGGGISSNVHPWEKALRGAQWAQAWNQTWSQWQCGLQVPAGSSQCPSLVACKLHCSHCQETIFFPRGQFNLFLSPLLGEYT